MKTVFFDIDTQVDFMLPAGALYVPGAERMLPVIAKQRSAAIFVARLITLALADAFRKSNPKKQMKIKIRKLPVPGPKNPS